MSDFCTNAKNTILMKWFFKCFKQYADFEGRARRKEFWWFNLINYLINIVLGLCMVPMLYKGMIEAEDDPMAMMAAYVTNPFYYILCIYSLAVLVPSIAVMVRRFHDIGKSGYWAFFWVGAYVLMVVSCFAIGVGVEAGNVFVGSLLLLASFAMMILCVVWWFKDSQEGENKWDENPKGVGNTDEPCAIEDEKGFESLSNSNAEQ